MSRPNIHSYTNASIKIEVPAGWYANLSAISRKTYNQLITVEVEIDGEKHSNYLANEWGKSNQPMRDIDSPSDTISIKPQEKTFYIVVNCYFSTNPKVKEDELENDNCRSSRVNILGTQRPPKPPVGFPDYNTFLFFIEDSAATAAQGAPEFDDSLITLNIIQSGIPPPKPDTGSAALTQNGKDAVLGWIDIVTDGTKPGPTVDPGTLEPNKYPPSPHPVGIIGAGIAGLYAGLMLQSLGIKYEILEGSGRVGGRLYTHNFPKNSGKYQYYDVGAMRYPDTTFMTRTFKLAKETLGIQMLDYLRSNDNAFMCYNGVSVTKTQFKAATDKNLQKKEDIFKVTQANDGLIPEDHYQKGSGYFWDVILDEFRQYFVLHPFHEAFKKLKQWEEHSVRSYLLVVKKVPYAVVDWYEKMESRTGLFDASLTETVLASLVFNDPNKNAPDVKWYCFDGGSEVLHKAVTDRLNVKPQLYMRATDIREVDEGAAIEVEFDTRANPRPSAQGRTKKKFSNVISTMSFACLRLVNLDHLYLSYGQKDAIRTLNYTPSIKIGMQFKTAWWETKCDIVGGQSSTDRPVRDMVYPSYGPDSSHPGSKKSNCMIVAYNGMQDAQRLGGLMKGRDTPEEKTMLELVMKDLAAVHKVPVDDLWDEFEDYHPWDFYRDEFQLGAFCQFGPGQFDNVYPHVCQPGSKQQRFYFAGDACSTFHGWVAGALNSAWRSVNQMLIAHPELNPNPSENILDKFKAQWGDSEEWDVRDLTKLTQINAKLAQMNLQP